MHHWLAEELFHRASLTVPRKGDRTINKSNGRSVVKIWDKYKRNSSWFFPTELTVPVFNDTERTKRNAQQTCIGRNGKLEDLDGPLLFLCSRSSDYVTGQLLFVDGGFTAK